MPLLVGCLMLLVIAPLFYALVAWCVFSAINFLYPLPFLATWGFWHYMIAGWLLSFISSMFKTKVEAK